MKDKNRSQWSSVPPSGFSQSPQRQRAWIRRHKIFIALLAIIGLIVVIAVTSAGGGGGEAPPAAEGGTATVPREGDQQKASPEDEPGIGDPVRDGKFEFIVTRVQPGVQEIGGEFGKEAQGQFILVHMTVSNIGDEAQLFDGGAQKLFDGKDREFSADALAGLYLEESKSFLNEINPGNNVKGIVVFDVPTDVKPVKLELHDSVFSGGVAVNLAP
ncbi:DUF4352 domain-containing protein [Streptomyces pristinaespiralis]|uniref:DUF4352 domain-containing protein n=1 Tax=Streptomyces pristinaespiralis TaxID=38300 RepID=UPI003835BDC5